MAAGGFLDVSDDASGAAADGPAIQPPQPPPGAARRRPGPPGVAGTARDRPGPPGTARCRPVPPGAARCRPARSDTAPPHATPTEPGNHAGVPSRHPLLTPSGAAHPGRRVLAPRPGTPSRPLRSPAPVRYSQPRIDAPAHRPIAAARREAPRLPPAPKADRDGRGDRLDTGHTPPAPCSTAGARRPRRPIA